MPVQKILGEKVGRRKRSSSRMIQQQAEQMMMREAIDAVILEEACVVSTGRLIKVYSPLESEQAMFEIDTDKGVYVVIRSRTGEHTIILKHDAPSFL